MAEVELTLPIGGLSPDQLWEFMWRRKLQTRWLGTCARVVFTRDRRFSLGDEAGAWRVGRVRRARARRLEATLHPPLGAQGAAGDTTLAISVAAAEDGSALLRVEESGFADDSTREESRLYWTGALTRLRGLVAGARARRERPRQAVVIVHGIGEQQPGRTLQDFVRAEVISEGVHRRWVKPDRISGSFELRSVTFEATANRETPTTDVFELYWANVIRDTTLGQVLGWVRSLLLRRSVPRPILAFWLLGWAVVVIVLCAVIAQVSGIWDLPTWLASGGALAIVAALVWKALGRGLAIDVVGDAARYLSPRPANVAHRETIRKAGVDLLERLHTGGRYDRIVLLGHSLGSVIAYDIVTHAWIRMHASHSDPETPSFSAVRSLERAIGSVTDTDEAQRLQHEAWKEQRGNTHRWLVTDLVTVGSPLTYADFLMASGPNDLAESIAHRILPSCPPTTEIEAKTGHRRCSFERAYRDIRGDRVRTFTLFNHAAPFAVTRWTNLYFTTRWFGLIGDPVGGPVAPLLGAWVRDVPLATPARRFTHGYYWRPVVGSNHLDALRAAIGPRVGAELTELATEMPTFVAAEHAEVDS